jgi:hypothetical protein
MKDMKYCPLCGTEFENLPEKKCKYCSAQEYRIFGFLIGYLYPAEYRQFNRLFIIIMILITIAMLIWYISSWRISLFLPEESFINRMAGVLL